MLTERSTASFLTKIKRRRETQYLERILEMRKQGSSSLLGINDYSYLPLALGDTFTMLVKMAIEAHRVGAKNLRLYLNVEGRFMKQQPHINEFTYRHHIANLLPAFLCSPIPTSIHLLRRSFDINPMFVSAKLKKQGTWPRYDEHLRQEVDYYSHFSINSFFKEFGFIPKLVAPVGYQQRKEKIKERFFKNKFLVAVNIRQRGFTDHFSQLNRDSSQSAWYRFFDIVADKYPNVMFLNMGANNEWDRPLAHKKNVVISRMEGLSLGDELALMMDSGLFMGTSSGFAAAATFSSIPYVITHFENIVANRLEISIGDNYPFANENQTLSWVPETTDLLLDLFEAKYRNLK